MFKTFILIGLVLTIGCKHTQFDKSDLPSQDLIDSVIVSVINLNSIKLINRDSISFRERKFALLDSVINFKVITKKDLEVNKFDYENCFIIDCLTLHPDFRENNNLIFNKVDSSFMVFQSQNFRTYRLNNSLFEKALIIDKKYIHSSVIDNKHKPIGDVSNDLWWIEIHQPLFSYNKDYAIIELDVNCVWRDCNFGDIFILKKVNNKWVIIKAIRQFEA